LISAVQIRTAAIALALGILLPLATDAADGERTLTLEDAIVRALQKNEGILVEREGLEAARAAERGARGIYDPLLRIDTGWRRAAEPANSTFSGAPLGRSAPTSAGYNFDLAVQQRIPSAGTVSLLASTSRQTTDSTFSLLSPAYFTRLGIELRQPLLVLLPGSTKLTKYTISVAALDRDRATASLRREVSDTVAGIERAYWTLDAARREIGVREEAVRLAEEQLQETGVRVEQGVAAEAERAQPRAELERRRGELLASREALARAENAVKLLILGEEDTDLWPASLATTGGSDPETVPMTVDAWIEQALASRPEVKAAQATVERRRLEAALAREQSRPTFDAIVGYDRYGFAGTRNPLASAAPGGVITDLGPIEGGLSRSFGTLNDSGFSGAHAGVVFQVPIGNRAARASAAVAASAERQAQTQLVQVRKVVRVDVLDAAAALQTADQRIAAARAAREAAEVQLSAERDRFAVGLSTNFLVLTRQNDLSRARLDEIASLHDYRNARTGVARATGALLDERKISVEGN
jgi:outer membrane protein TolC